MFSPEELAQNIVYRWYRGPYHLHPDTDAMNIEITDIAAALQSAYDAGRAAERERAALCAESFVAASADGRFARAVNATAHQIAAAIRAHHHCGE